MELVELKPTKKGCAEMVGRWVWLGVPDLANERRLVTVWGDHATYFFHPALPPGTSACTQTSAT